MKSTRVVVNHLTARSRFLRARSFDIAGAHRQFSDAEKWRQKYGVDELYTSARPEDMKDAQRFYPRWTGRRDKVFPPFLISPPDLL